MPRRDRIDRFKKVHSVDNRTDFQAHIGDVSVGHCSDESRPDMMKHLTILGLSFGLAGCFGYGPYASTRAFPEKTESGGIPIRTRIGFKIRAGKEASMGWGSRIRRICVRAW